MRFRKIIAVCLVFCMLITTGIVSSLAASDDILVYADEVNADAGQSFTVPIMISGNTGLSAIGLNLTYDQDKITPVSVKKGTVLSSGMTDNSIGVGTEAKFNILWYSTRNVTANGVIFNVEFLAKSSASGMTAIGIEIDCDNTFSSNYSTPSITAKTVSVNIKGNDEHYHMPEITVPVVPDGVMTFYSETTFGIYNREADIPIKIKNNTGLMGFKLNLIYDDNAIEIKNVSDSSLTKNGSLYYNDKVGNLSVLWNSSEEFDSDGTVFTVTVKYKEAIKTDISIMCNKDDTFDGLYSNPETICQKLNIGIRKKGDVTLDGDVKINDATSIQKYLAKLERLSEESVLLADCDNNGTVTISDATIIQKAIAKLIELQ